MAEFSAYETTPSWFQRFSEFMRKDTKGVEIISYSLSGILFVVAYRKIRPFTRFGKASDIPQHFVRHQIRQYGRVDKIEPSLQHGPLLIVRHRPPANILFWSRKTIPIKVNGIDVNANGYSWLESVVSGNEISFIPMVASSANQHAECRVLLTQPNRTIDVGDALLSLGFAKLTVSVPKTIRNRKDAYEAQLHQYYRSLAQSERYAKDRRNGLWQYTLPPRIWPLSLWPAVWDKVVYSKRLPVLVR
ncbi:uncharacterized protein LOC125951393 [Anopheles darlingi]|nr:uncharacterized protein LOC125951393 [Anopheles darlingi]XP_049536169.1 uncharacterized protein LOC125951393 [Anopheles darlingi]XP_049536170.1 uncharacterized protein LOC125951393 [Anopheles darlingi]